jgi:hypothetical protein
MLIYKDIITGHQLCTDAFRVEETEYFYIIHGKNIKEDNEIDEAMIGGNKSEEAEEEALETVVTVVPNLLASCQAEEVDTCQIGKGKAADMKKKIMAYLTAVKKMPAEDYNAKKQENKFGDKTDYATELRDATFAKLLRKLTPEEIAVETERGNVFNKKEAKFVVDVVLFDNFCDKDKFMKWRWYAAGEDQYELEGQIMPLTQEGEAEGDKCSMVLWKMGCFEETC